MGCKRFKRPFLKGIRFKTTFSISYMNPLPGPLFAPVGDIFMMICSREHKAADSRCGNPRPFFDLGRGCTWAYNFAPIFTYK